jgi:signal transduction histidine kinase
MIFDQGYGKNTGFGLFFIREVLGITGITIQETGIPGSGVLFEITVPKAAWKPYMGEKVRDPVVRKIPD